MIIPIAFLRDLALIMLSVVFTLWAIGVVHG